MLDFKNFYEELTRKYKYCDFAFIPINHLEKREKEYFKFFMPEAITAIVIFYPVKDLDDWTWCCPDGKKSSERCNIDDMANDVCRFIVEILTAYNFFTINVPYPGKSGLQFRFVAAASGYGEIGRNAFYLHPEWGTKVHLRVLASKVKSDLYCSIKSMKTKICSNCGICVQKCPADAFENGFDGLKCREFRSKRGEYIPFGPKGILRYCETCITVCRAGNFNIKL